MSSTSAETPWSNSGQLLAEPVEVVPVRVPEAVGDRDAPGPGLDQPAGDQELVVPPRARRRPRAPASRCRSGRGGGGPRGTGPAPWRPCPRSRRRRRGGRCRPCRRPRRCRRGGGTGRTGRAGPCGGRTAAGGRRPGASAAPGRRGSIRAGLVRWPRKPGPGMLYGLCCMTGNRSKNGGTTGSTAPWIRAITEPKLGLPSRWAWAHREAGDVLEARVLVAQADDRADHRDLVHQPRRSAAGARRSGRRAAAWRSA